MRFAIFSTGGKQYKACVGDKIKIEKIDESLAHSEIKLDNVLMVGDEDKLILANSSTKACVTVKVLDTSAQKKVIVFKKRRRKNYRRKFGHRQTISSVIVTDISLQEE